MRTPHGPSILILACWLVSCATDEPPEAAASPEPLRRAFSVCGFANPESVAAHAGHRYVSNIGAVQDPTAVDGDGFISDLDARGNVLELSAFKPEVAPLNAPKGLAIVEDRLYVADIDRVVGFDIETREPVFEAKWEPGAPTLLNDLAVLDDQTLLVSDTLGGALLRLDLETSSLATFVGDVPGANGIAIDARRHLAWIVGVGADFAGGGLFVIDLTQAQPSAHQVDGPFGILDGIAVLPNGNLVISDWVSLEPAPGRLLVVTSDGEERRSIELGELQGPADFYFDRRRDALWIPAMTENCVRVSAVPRRHSSSR